MSKKLRKEVVRHGPLLVVAPDAEIDAWKACAELLGKSPIEFARMAMNRLADEIRLGLEAIDKERT